jgi:hypothetical protein
MLDPDRRRLLDSVLRTIQTACRVTADGDEESITAFIARFFQRVLGTISAESRRESAHPSPQLADAPNRNLQPEMNFFSDFDSTFNDQVSLSRHYTRKARLMGVGQLSEGSFDADR